MSYDLQLIRDRAPRHVTMSREHAIYLDTERAGGKIQKAHNVADLLERGHRTRASRHTALLVDLKA